MSDPKQSSQAFFIAMVGAAAAILAAILFGAPGCSDGKSETRAEIAPEPSSDPFDMKCEEIDGTSGLLQRCVNTEVICYLHRNETQTQVSLSCVPNTGP